MDSDHNFRRTLPGLERLPTPQLPLRFWLEYHGRTFELPPGGVMVGRSSECHVVLEDALVSRRHAQIIVTQEGASVEDLGSANGVFVNGNRVAGKAPLSSGDQLQVGKQLFVVRALSRPSLSVPSERLNAETLHGGPAAEDLSRVQVPRANADTAADPRQAEPEPTHREEALQLLGGVADKVLALGRGEEAERVLATALNHVLAAVKRGHEPPFAVLHRAATYAGKLAEATSHGKWLDYTIELYASLRRPLPIEFVDQMYAVLRRVDAVNLTALRAYLAVLSEHTTTYGPNERFAIQRLEGFERLVALR